MTPQQNSPPSTRFAPKRLPPLEAPNQQKTLGFLASFESSGWCCSLQEHQDHHYYNTIRGHKSRNYTDIIASRNATRPDNK